MRVVLDLQTPEKDTDPFKKDMSNFEAKTNLGNKSIPLSSRVPSASSSLSMDLNPLSARASSPSPSAGSRVPSSSSKNAYSTSHPSSKSIADMVSEMQRVTTMNRISVKFSEASGPTNPTLFCEKGPIRFEMEISIVTSNSHQHVIRMKRVSGDQFAYKNLCNRILPQLKL